MPDFSAALGFEPQSLTGMATALAAYSSTWLEDGGESLQYVEIVGGDQQPEPRREEASAADIDPFFAVPREERLSLAAGCSTLAATYRLLVDQTAGREMFADAAARHRELEDPFFFTCAVLADPMTGYSWGLLDGEKGEPHHTLLGFALASSMDLWEELRLDEAVRAWVQEWGPYWAMPVGDAGLPLSAYVQAFLPLLDAADVASERLVPSLGPLLAGASQRLALMRQVETRWATFGWDAPPVDPDILATLVLALSNRQTRQVPVDVDYDELYLGLADAIRGAGKSS